MGSLNYVTRTNSGAQSATSYSWTHTTQAGATILYVLVSNNDSSSSDRTVSGITFNSDQITKAGHYDDATNEVRVEIWTLENPDIGGYTLEVTNTGKSSDTGAYAIDGQGFTGTVSDTGTASGGAEPMTASCVRPDGGGEFNICYAGWATINLISSSNGALINTNTDID